LIENHYLRCKALKTTSKAATAFLGFTLFLAGCGNSNHEGHQMQNGDLQEKTASVDVLPSFLMDKPENIRAVYQIAAKSVDVLQWIPCYCGCGESAGHKSNENCFVKELNKDGSVVWDDHGTRCNVCMQIAVESVQMKIDGKTNKEIRQTIDQKYKSGYAKPTDTPMPA
jgi:hypothetical protein